MAKSRSWIWFFAVLVVLASAAVGINWYHNVSQQLKPEELAAAEKLWAEKGPADYDLTIIKRVNSRAADEQNEDTIEAKIRARQVIAATINGGPMERRNWHENDIPTWFAFIREFQEIDLKPGAPRTFRAATFSKQNGALLHFRRRVGGTRERQEIIIQVKPPT